MTSATHVRASRQLRVAAGIVGLAAIVLALPAAFMTLGAVGGRALDFSGRALTLGERLLYAAAPVGIVALFWIARAMWRGRRSAIVLAAIAGLALGVFFLVRLVAGLSNGPPGELPIDLQAVVGLAAVIVFELLLWTGIRTGAAREP